MHIGHSHSLLLIFLVVY